MIKVGFLVSYDYAYLYRSLPMVYDNADAITLAIDADNLTWSGNPIVIDDSFYKWISKTDVNNKITIYKDKFYVPENTPTENDTRERQLLGKAMGEGGWHIQIDSDEYFVDFKGFANYLKSISHYLKNPEKKPVEVYVQWITLFRKVEGGFLYINGGLDPIEVATNLPDYKYMRANLHSKKIITKFILLHQSWARDEEEIYTKIKNWSHNNDIDSAESFNFWKSINLDNYKTIRNFHGQDPRKWESLGFVAKDDILNLTINISDADIRKLQFKKQLIRVIRKYLPVSVEKKIAAVFVKLTK